MHRFLNVTSNHTLHVIFKKDINTITASATQGGFINPMGVINVSNGENKTFNYAPEQGYQLVRVLIDGINDPTAVQNGFHTFFNVSDDHTIAAQFEKKKYTVSLPSVEGATFIPVGGSVSPVEHGGNFMFTVDLHEGYTQSLINVFANNLPINLSSGVYTVKNIMADQVITIQGVDLNQYKIVAKAYNGGTISPAGTFMVTHGAHKSFEIIPNANYSIKYVLVNGTSVGAVTSYIFNNVDANATIEAYFQFGQGIDANDEASIEIFSHNNVVTILNGNLIPVKHVEIIDMYGRIIWTGQAFEEKTEITLNVATGIYGVRITTGDGQKVSKVNIMR
jgi:hypothetical protein